jgi:hypothetical protein
VAQATPADVSGERCGWSARAPARGALGAGQRLGNCCSRRIIDWLFVSLKLTAFPAGTTRAWSHGFLLRYCSRPGAWIDCLASHQIRPDLRSLLYLSRIRRGSSIPGNTATRCCKPHRYLWPWFDWSDRRPAVQFTSDYGTKLALTSRQAFLRGSMPRINLSPSSPSQRLSLIGQHISAQSANPSSQLLASSSSRKSSFLAPDQKSIKMSSQPEHPALLIPGPIEFDDAVLQSMGHFSYVMPTRTRTMSLGLLY